MARDWQRFLLGFLGCFMTAQAAATGVDAYRTLIQPLLRERCISCHGALQQKAGLRLDTVAALLRGGDSGPAVVPAKARASILLQRVTTADVAERMPPQHEGLPLDAAQAEAIRQWIDAGAPAPANEQPDPDPRDHWAFRPPVRPAVPASSKAFGAIDALLEADRSAHGLRARPEARREVLVRRLFLDLIGLPPAADEWRAVMSDPAADWYERLVDRLLSDPRYGERWARHWMDIWRYSDAWGLGDQLRNSQKHIHHWRDWIVESLNADVPYDEMIRLMLAADELHPEDPGRLRATGYLARNYFLFNRNQWLDETVEHVSKGFLGLTLNCAKCHDHKYDPFPQADYYRMRAFFEPYHVRLDVRPGEPDLARDGLPRAYDRDLDRPTFRFIRGNEAAPDTNKVILPGVPALLARTSPSIQRVVLPARAHQPERNPWVLEAHVAAARERDRKASQLLASETPPDPLRRAVAERRADVARADLESVLARAEAMRASWHDRDPGTTSSDAEVARMAAVKAERRLAAARAQLSVAEAGQKVAEAEATKKDAARKELDSARKKAEEAVARCEAAVATHEQPATLAGAAWTPTRFLDSTKDDPDPGFPRESTGRRTALARWIASPDNPLTARVAVNHVWGRHFGVPLVPTVFDFGRKGTPPANQPLLDALAVEFMERRWSLRHLHRVIVLSAAYRMASTAAGADVEMGQDPENRRLWRRVPLRMEAQVVRDSLLAHAGRIDAVMGGPVVPSDAQATSRRRSLYFQHSNNERNAFLATFDDATVKECYRRDASIVPQQALALLNARVVHDVVPDIARRIAARSGLEDDRRFVREAFVTLLGFEPGTREMEASLQAMAAWRNSGEANAARANADAASQRAREGLAWSLINHTDFVTIR
jgi:hypothetical protein